MFDGAIRRIKNTRITLARGTMYVGWDFICLGRPAAGERFESGTLSQRMEILRDGKPVWLRAAAHLRSSRWHRPMPCRQADTGYDDVYGQSAENVTDGCATP